MDGLSVMTLPCALASGNQAEKLPEGASWKPTISTERLKGHGVECWEGRAGAAHRREGAGCADKGGNVLETAGGLTRLKWTIMGSGRCAGG